jgi:hypothetical protein
VDGQTENGVAQGAKGLGDSSAKRFKAKLKSLANGDIDRAKIAAITWGQITNGLYVRPAGAGL